MRIQGLLMGLTVWLAPLTAGAGDIGIIVDEDIPVRGPYVPATVVGNVVYTSGQIAVDPRTGELVDLDVRAQVRQSLKNLEAVLTAAGSSLEHTLKVNVFLKNAGDFQAMNEVYREFFPDHRPARTTVPGADWGNGVLVEVDAIALRLEP